jgi:hypothetical protein
VCESRERFLLFLEIFLQLVEIFRLVGLVGLTGPRRLFIIILVLGTCFLVPLCLAVRRNMAGLLALEASCPCKIRIIGVFLLLLPTLLSEGAFRMVWCLAHRTLCTYPRV